MLVDSYLLLCNLLPSTKQLETLQPVQFSLRPLYRLYSKTTVHFSGVIPPDWVHSVTHIRHTTSFNDILPHLGSRCMRLPDSTWFLVFRHLSTNVIKPANSTNQDVLSNLGWYLTALVSRTRWCWLQRVLRLVKELQNVSLLSSYMFTSFSPLQVFMPPLPRVPFPHWSHAAV